MYLGKSDLSWLYSWIFVSCQASFSLEQTRSVPDIVSNFMKQIGPGSWLFGLFLLFQRTLG